MVTRLITIVFFAVASLSATADHLYWKGADSQTANNWMTFGDAANWSVGDEWTSAGANQKYPGPDDLIHMGKNYSGYFWFDLTNADYTVSGMTDGGETKWGPRNIHLRNGSLTFTGDVTNIYWYVTLESAAKLVLSKTSAGRFGHQAQANRFYVNDGCEMAWLGTYTLQTSHTVVYSGGKFTLDPAAALVAGVTFAMGNGKGASFTNFGEMEIPRGVTFSGTTGSSDAYLTFSQAGGTMTLGGPLVLSATKANERFELCGGTLKVTNDVSFTRTGTTRVFEVAMTNDCTATVDVDAAKTLDLSTMTFGTGTTLTKTGLGTLKLGAVPNSLAVNGGTITFAANTSLGSSLTLAAGTTLCLGASGISATAIAGLADATVTLDSSFTAGLIFSSSDSALVKQLGAKLTASGVTNLVIGENSISREFSHDATIFAWSDETATVTYQTDFRGGTYTWHEFLDPTSWKIGVARAVNTGNLLPDAEDDLFISDTYNVLFAMDMCGQHRKVKNLYRNLVAGGTYKNQSGFRQFNVRNGTLEFTGSYTNVRASVDAKATGKFILGATSSARIGHQGAENRFIAEDGGEIDLYGSLCIHRAMFEVDAGGKMVFQPAALSFDTNTAQTDANDWMTNCGTLELPNGLTLSARAWKGIASTNTITQRSGTLKLGGSIVRQSQYYYKALFRFEGGTIQATDDAAISGFDVCEMTENASGTVDVAAGTTLDLSAMTFAVGTSLVKTGSGILKLGKSVPSALSVSEGSIAFSGDASLGSGLSLAAGTTVILGQGIVSADAISGVESATFSIDSSVAGRSLGLFTSVSAELLSAVAARLKASSSTPGAIGVVGGMVTYETAHDSTVFSWKNEGTGRSTSGCETCETNMYGDALFTWYSYCDSTSWAVGTDKSGGNPNNLFPGANDDMYVSSAYYPIFGMDLGGASRQLKNLFLNLDAQGKYPEQVGFRGFFIRNGSLEFTGSFTNVRTVVKAKTNGTFILGKTSASRLGYNGAQDIFYADDGGEIDLLGTMHIHFLQFTVAEGGTAVIDPKKLTFFSNSNQHSYIRNNGTLSFPSGLDLTSATTGTNSELTISQNAGTLNLGGPISRATGFKLPLVLTLGGGTLNVTNLVSFSGLTTFTMADNATLDVNIPMGSRLNLTNISFGENTTINHHGKGHLVLGTNMPTHYNRDYTPGLILMVR